MQSPRFISNARSLEELRSEFISDIHRRIATLDSQQNIFGKNAAVATRIAARKTELEEMLDFWQKVELKGRKPPRLKEAAQ